MTSASPSLCAIQTWREGLPLNSARVIVVIIRPAKPFPLRAMWQAA
jgi:hypothetical protein